MKKIIILLIAMVLTISLAGCKGNENISETPDKLVIWMGKYWAGEGEEDLKEMAALWTAESGIDVEIRLQQDINTKLKSAKRSGEQIDIIVWDRWETSEFVKGDFFVDLTKYISDNNIDTDDYHQEAINELTVDNKVYGLPLELDPHGIFVNTDVVTNLPETWDELYTEAVNATVKSGDSYSRVGLHLDIAGYFNSFIQTAGGEMVNGDQAAFNSDYGYSVLSYWKTLFEAGVYSPGAVSGDNFTASDPFLSGKVAMRIDSLLNAGKYYELNAQDDFNYAFIPFPKGPSVSSDISDSTVEAGTMHGGLLGGYGLTISSNSDYPDTAFDLIKWWVGNDENMMKWYDISGCIPSRSTVLDNTEYYNTLMADTMINKVLPELEYYKARPNVNGYTNVENAIVTPLIKALLEQGTYNSQTDPIQSCLDEMETKANARFDFQQ